MGTRGQNAHNKRNLVLCLVGTYVLFLTGSAVVLTILLPFLERATNLVPRTLDRGALTLELSATLTIVIAMIAIPLGFVYMYFFGGIVSPKVMKLYLFITKGTHVIVPREPGAAPSGKGRGVMLKLRRQLVYFGFILAVVVSFATYLAKNKEPIVAPLGRPSDVASLITGDFVTLTMTASLIVPVVALALPYFGGLRLRTIDVGPFHTTVLSTVVGISGGFALLYSLLSKPILQYILFYVFLFMGVSWCFAMGCNLAADPANRHIAQEVFSAKPNSRLLSSKIWLEVLPGKLVEV